MKKIIFIIVAILFIPTINAQESLKGMKYQAVARDLSGELIANQDVSLKISLQSNLGSKIHYTEIHNVVTNQFGLFSLVIGDGIVEQGNFNKIPWSTQDIWMEIAIKDKGNTNFKTISNSQLLAVPYAFHAMTASELINSNRGAKNPHNAGVPAQVWSLFGNSKTDPTKDKLGTTDAADLVMITNNIERLRITSDGDVNIKKSLSIDENLTVAKNVYLNTVTGETINNGNFTVEGMSSTYLTGTLTVDKATHLKDILNVNGLGQFDSNINIDASTVTDKLVVTDEATPNPMPRFGSIADIRGLFVADSISILGGLDIGGNLRVHGDSVIVDNHLLVGGSANFKDQLTINATLTGGESNYNAYPFRIEGSNQGIAIKINKATPDNGNNFVTFFDNNNTVRGRIEGETTTDLLTNPEYIWDNAVFAVDILINTAELGIAIADEVQAIVDQVASDTSVTNCTGAGVGAGAVVVNVTCIPIPSLIFASIADVIVKGANIVVALANEAEAIALPIAYNAFKLSQIGVTYQSGAGDYAEWLPKINLNSKFYPGDIVGVKAGRISLNTMDAEMHMVISSNPIVLGNMPEEGTERQYEKIAFMGQVPVKVYGIVNEGDYILPSGNNDGFGIAVSPEKLKPSDYQKIVGIAWSSSNSLLNFVNVAVGLNANDVTRLVVKQEKRIEKQTSEISELKARLDKIDILLSNFDPKYNAITQNDTSETLKMNTPDDVSYDESEPFILYITVTKEQIEGGIIIAEERLRKNGVDVDQHPFFMKLRSDPDYKRRYMEKVIDGYKTEIQIRSKIDKKAGVSVKVN